MRVNAKLGTLALLLAGAASAQPAALPAFELERLELNPSAAGSLVLGTGELLPAGSWRVNVAGHYEHDPLVLYRNDEPVGSVVGSRLTAHLVAAYAVTGRVELGLQLPLVLMQQGEDLTAQGVAEVSGGGLSTPVVSARVGLLSQLQGGPVDLAVELGAGLPVGSEGALARESGVRIAPRIMAGRRLGWLRGAVDVGMHLRPAVVLANDANVQDERGSELRLGAALATTGDGLRGELNLRGSVPLAREGGAVELLAGARMPFSEWVEGYALAGPGFGSAPGTPVFRVLLGVALGRTAPACVAGGRHRPEECPLLDDDGDGVLNGEDTCPTEAGSADAGGCPPKDADGDGIEDAKDACPTEAGAADRQGCPLKDADGDGIEDAKDACPAEAGAADRQGCPLKDADSDGIEDAKDACPAEAGPADRQGCPVKDADQDGVEDSQDACPTEAGKPELRGCPEKDDDGDGVANAVDNCRTEKGPASNQGCPENQKQLVAITQGRLDIKERVFFDTGKSSIQQRSFPVLDQVARVLVEHPEVAKVLIEGHTDDVGNAESNRTLSQQRADAVRAYLIMKGVDPGRLASQGFGPDQPLVPNTSPEARATNRRVEFIIQDVAQPPQPAPRTP